MHEEIISKYCGDIEDRIRACRSKQVAEFLKKHLCSELKQYALNQEITEDLKLKIDNFIQKYFSKDGKNILICHESNQRNIN
jgi:predicted GIY-YIG superfamily endonuclease